VQEKIPGEDVSDTQLIQFLDAIGDTGALVLFALIVFGMYVALLLASLFCALAVRVAYIWLARHTWGNVIVGVERRALR
jgi:hypothetical protein